MHVRAAMLIVLAVLFAAGTAIIPIDGSRTVTAADEGVGVARLAALGLQLSQPSAVVQTARYQSVATLLANHAATAADFSDLETPGRYQMVAASLANGGPAANSSLAIGETVGKSQAVADMLANCCLEAAGRQELSAAAFATKQQSAMCCLVAGPEIGAEAFNEGLASRYGAVPGMLASRELGAAPLESAGRAVEPARLAAALAMAPLAEHETEEEEGEEGEQEVNQGDGETFESANYDYTITFDDSAWEVVDESEQEDESGNPFEVLQLGSEAAVVTFYGLASDFNDAEECVESLEDFVAGIDGIDDVEERDDIEGDDEDSSVVIDYLYEPEDTDETEWTSLLRCQMIEDEEVFLMTWYDALHDNYEDDDNEEAREELLDGVEVG